MRPITAIAALASALLLVACNHYTAPPAARGDVLTRDQYPNIVATGGLSNYLLINDVSEIDRNGLLDLSVDMRWAGREPVYVEYRFFFLDRSGRPEYNEPAWRRAEAGPGLATNLRANATRPTSTDWRLEIRPDYN